EAVVGWPWTAPKAMWLPLEELERGVAASAPPQLGEAHDDLVGNVLVGGPLEDQQWRELGLLAALEDASRIALDHCIGCQPVAVMILDQVVLLRLFRVLVPGIGIDDGPAGDEVAERSILMLGAWQRQRGVAGVLGPHGAQDHAV